MFQLIKNKYDYECFLKIYHNLAYQVQREYQSLPSMQQGA